MTLHKLSAGSGYTYLTRQVAANAAAGTGHANLGEYYSEWGEAPGVWLGRGLDGLEHGPVAGERVGEEQMVALFGHGRHPNADVLESAALADGHDVATAVRATSLGAPFVVRAGSTAFRRELARRIVSHNGEAGMPAGAPVPDGVRARLRSEIGREQFARDNNRAPRDERELTDYVTGASRPGATSVAGYDLRFSSVKSVSALWALAGPDVACEAGAAHDAAARDVIDWLEREVTFTRLGHNGTRQVDARGLLAVAFTHRDSRAGDPDLHTHIAISNKVQTLDGAWRALDGRVLYRAGVAASERYNTRLEAQLTHRLGVRFADRPGGDGKRAVREIVGVDPALMRFWSKRRDAITRRQEQLAADFTRRHGRAPDFGEQTRLFGQANTETRQGKHAPRSELEQRHGWWREAAAVLGDDAAVISMLESVGITTGQPREVTPASVEVDAGWVHRTAAEVITTVSATYSTWRCDIVRAEIERRARAGTVPLADIDAVVEQTVARAVSAELSIALGPREVIDEPAALRRCDGATGRACSASLAPS